MTQKKYIALIPSILLAFAFGVVLTQAWGPSLKDISAGIVAYTLFGFLIVAYLLRFVFIFLGVFAIYKVLREKYQEQTIV